MGAFDSHKKLLVIIGASGVGKTTIAQELQHTNTIQIVPTWTTRPPRDASESQLGQHVFVKEEEFANKQQEGFFLETVQLFKLPYTYGCPIIAAQHEIPTILLRVFLLDLLKKHYPNLCIYQIETDKQQAIKRLNEREKTPMGTRLDQFENEQAAGRLVANRVFSNNTENDINGIVADVKKALGEDFASLV